jgi:type IV secretory pathway VirB4 component
MLSLREYRNKADRLADFLPWAALVAPGVVLNKDGSFQRSARFRGPDLDSATPAELIATTARLNSALRRLGSGWAIFVEAVRRPAQDYPDSDFPDPASALVERERAAQFAEEGAHFESGYFLTLLWMPPAEDAARAESWLYEGKAEKGINPKELLDLFIDRTDRLLRLVEGFVPEVAWLDDSETLTYLHSCISTRSHRVRVSLHVGDVGHTLIVGPTGAGKSVLLALMALQFRRYPQAQVFAFDFGGSIRAAALACGGDWQDLGTSLSEDSAGAVLLQPLARIDEAAERNWAAEWLQAILTSEGVGVDPATKEHLWSALTSLATAPIAERTLTGLAVLLQSQALKQALAPYCIGGPFGRLLDAEVEHLGEASFQAFETEGLTGSAAAPAVLSYLFHRIEGRLDGSPTMIIIDEGWLVLDSPAFAAQLREWLKTLRKKNASVVLLRLKRQQLVSGLRGLQRPGCRLACGDQALHRSTRAFDIADRTGLNFQGILEGGDAAPPTLFGTLDHCALAAGQIDVLVLAGKVPLDLLDIIGNALRTGEQLLGLPHLLLERLEHRHRQRLQIARLVDQRGCLVLQLADLVVDLLERARRRQDVLRVVRGIVNDPAELGTGRRGDQRGDGHR